MPQLTLTHDDGSTETIAETVGWNHTREIGMMERLRVTVPRDDAQSVTLEPKRDTLDLDGVFTGRLVDVETGGSTWTLIAYSFEWDAKQVEPTAGGVLKTGTDNDLITEFIGSVPEWSVGSVATLTGSVSFVFNHAFAHEALRRIERNVPGELRFNSDSTVDYVDALGSDKTASVTLSAAAGNLNGEIQVQNKGRKLDATHLRVIGAHEGEAQLSATLVPDDDPATYSNRVNYSTTRWEPGDPRNWDRWSNKEVSDQAAIEEEAAALADDLTRELVEATATVEGEDLSLGDWVRVSKPDAGIDRDMRVHRITTRSEGANVVDDVLLSTRTVAREGDTDQNQDIQRFNTAFQGSEIWNTTSGGIQPVDSGVNYVLPFYYPDVDYEHRVEVYVAGRPYRAYSKGAASGGGSHSHSVTISDHTHSVSYGVPYHNHSILNTQTYQTGTTDTHSHTYERASLTGAPSNNEVDTSTSASGGGTEVTSSSADAPHSHSVEPGVIEFGTETPSGCDIIVNGATVVSNIGGGTFETVRDISGELTQGTWNTIEITSDSLGHVLAAASVEAYRQLGAN